MYCSSLIHSEHTGKSFFLPYKIRELQYLQHMRSSAIRRLPLPLPRFWQGLHFPFIADIQRMSYFGKWTIDF